MRPSSPILGGVLRFAVVFGVLAFPWSGLQEAYSRAFRRAGDAIFGSYGPRGVVRFLPSSNPNRTSDTEITTGVQGERRIGFSNISPRLLGYLPTIEVVALVVASAVAWRRRLLALFIAVALVHVFLYGRLWLLIRVWYSNESPWQQYHPGENGLAILKHVNEVVNISPTAGFVVPVLIWIAVTFRYSDLEQLLRRNGRPFANEPPVA